MIVRRPLRKVREFALPLAYLTRHSEFKSITCKVIKLLRLAQLIESDFNHNITFMIDIGGDVMKQIMIPIAILTLSLTTRMALASEYSTAISGCRAAIEQEMAATPLTHNVFKRAKRKGAHKVNLYFDIYYANGSGEQELSKVQCQAMRLSGDVLELSIE